MKNLLGPWGEGQAADFLKRQGLKILTQHFQTRWGEIDLIGRDRDDVVFIEVKARRRKSVPSAADSVTRSKQKRLLNAALSYMKAKRLEGCAMRFDVVLIEGDAVEWIKSAFEPAAGYTL